MVTPTDDPANILNATGSFDSTLPFTSLCLPDGRVVRLETALLVPASAPIAAADPEQTVIPLIEEQLQVTRRTVETGRVTLRKTMQEYEAVLDEPLALRSYEIERVVLNRPVDAAPGVRTEGPTTVYSLVEEQLVLTKQLILKEEVRVTCRDTEQRDTRSVTLRREHLVVDRVAAE